MGKHTKGPWTFSKDFDLTEAYWMIAPEGNLDGEFAQVDNVHDARLIAAAPDLLAACADANAMAKIHMPHMKTLISTLEAAIAKARGQS